MEGELWNRNPASHTMSADLSASHRNTTAATPEPIVRPAFVVPALPEPFVRISKPRFFASNHAKFTAPAR